MGLLNYRQTAWNRYVSIIPSFPRSRERVRELSELAGELDLGNELGSRLMVRLWAGK
jgi:hypothetical protein